MTQLVLPHTIDAGTEIVAVEHQANYTAIRDTINGQLEGGSGSSGNFKADGVTARELSNILLTTGLPGANYREGVDDWEHMLISPGAGLVLNYASGTAWVRDDSGVLGASALVPVTVSASTVTVPANASGNPRLDQVILTMTGYGTGTVSVLQGTPNAATTIDNRTGAAALPSDAIRLADVLTTNGFAGPYVNHTSLRNRMAWAHPITRSLSAAAAFDTVVDSLNDQYMSIEFNVEATAFVNWMLLVNGDAALRYSQVYDGVVQTSAPATTATAAGGFHNNGGHQIALSGTGTIAGGFRWAGNAVVGVRPMSSGAVTYSDYAISSSTGSGNQIIETRHDASITDYSIAPAITNIHYLSASAPALTGVVVFDRIPFTTAPV